MARIIPNNEQLARLKTAFGTLKAEDDDILRDPNANAFVMTKVYRRTQENHRCLLIGGKGSGKTAILVGYRRQQAAALLTDVTIDIKADDFPIQTLFSFFYADAKTRLTKSVKGLPQISDLQEFIEPTRLATFAWKSSLICTAVYVAAKEMMNEDSTEFPLSRNEKQCLLDVCKQVETWVGKTEDSPISLNFGSAAIYALLVYCFGLVQDVINSAIEVETSSLAIILSSATHAISQLIQSPFGEPKIEEAANIIRNSLKGNNKCILITLDKFDDFYDDFYKRTKNHDGFSDRRQFLSMILEGLILATRDINRTNDYDWVDALLTVPMDKFLELELRERAQIEHTHVVRLEWTPIELLEYVNRRIAYALDLPEDQIDQAWQLLFPFDVTNGSVRKVKEDSFLYIVRHTHWKPREVQMYLRQVLDLMEETGKPADELLFRNAVRRQSEKIIQREFIEEYRVEYPRLLSVMNKLENVSLDSIMPYEYLCDVLSGTSLNQNKMSPDEIVLRLFHIGMIGVRQVLARDIETNGVVRQNQQLIRYRYSHNYWVQDPFSQGVNVIFHPMFFEYLNIHHKEDYVINQLTWQMFL